MSHRWILTWLDSEPWLRILSFFSLGLLLLWLLWQVGIQPAEQTSRQLRQQIKAQRVHYYQQRRPLLTLPPLLSIEQQIALLTRPAVRMKNPEFSMPALLAASGVELERWQPGEQGGELMLNLSWQQFIGLLDILSACDRRITVSMLTLQGQAPRLQLLMALSNED